MVADFSNAFASDPLCHGIWLETQDVPKEPYWFLETYSTEGSGAGLHEPSDGISWWMLRRDQSIGNARFDGSDVSSTDAAHHVCFINKGRGGAVH